MKIAIKRILLVHNYYQQPGGEDQVFSAEAALLESHGHSVFRYTLTNDFIRDLNHVALAKSTIWNSRVRQEIREKIRRHKIQLVHFHNTFPLISPSAYSAARAEGAAVVQTLHNYRLICSNAYLFRDGHSCEECIGKTLPFPGILHSCYRNSRLATASVVGMLTLHRILQTWSRNVDIFIALTEFARQKFIEGGIPPDKIVVKPNFVSPTYPTGNENGDYAIFVGRISSEKGIETLLEAWKILNGKLHLKIVGGGPRASFWMQVSQHTKGIEWLGQKSREEVISLMQRAKLFILPSLVYENFPVTVAEAFCVGLPVLASGHGAMKEIVDHQRTGLHFMPGNPQALAAQVEWALSHPLELNKMKKEARAEFISKYTAEKNYQMLSSIYERAISRS